MDIPKRFKLGLSPGHSNVKPGARANGAEEEDIVFNVCQRAKAAALNEGWEVWTTNASLNTDPGIGARGRAARAAGCNVLVAVHLNAGPVGGKGLEVFYNAGDGEDKLLAEAVYKELAVVYGIPHGKPVKADNESSHTTLSELDEAGTIPAVLVELGFVTDPAFAELIKKPEAREVFALAIVRGVKRYLALKKGGKK